MFAFTHSEVGGFRLSTAKCRAGEEYRLEFTEDTSADRLPSGVVVRSGAFEGEYPNGDKHRMPSGFLSQAADRVRPKGVHTMRCVQDDSIYVCFRPLPAGAFSAERVEIASQREFPAGAVLLLATGQIDIDGKAFSAPRVLSLSSDKLVSGSGILAMLKR